MNGWSSYKLARVSLNTQLPRWLALASLKYGSSKVNLLSWLTLRTLRIPRDTNRSETFLGLCNECHAVGYTGPGHRLLSSTLKGSEAQKPFVFVISWWQEIGFIQPPWPSVSFNERESEVAQSCPTLCDPMDCSPPDFSVHGIFQARVLEWVAISFSRGSSQPRNQTRVSRAAGRCFTSEPPGKPRVPISGFKSLLIGEGRGSLRQKRNTKRKQ